MMGVSLVEMVSAPPNHRVSIPFFVPNIIGYVRLALTFFSVIFFHNHKLFIICYVLAFWADWLDGLFARHLDQCSQFGALLDMWIDRGSVITMFCCLSGFYPQLAPLFATFGFFDLTSHYVRMYYTLYSNQRSHKTIASSHTTFLLRIYYENRLFMAFVCIGHEVFFLFLYLLHNYDFLLPHASEWTFHFLSYFSFVHHLRSTVTSAPSVDLHYFGFNGKIPQEGLMHVLSAFMTYLFPVLAFFACLKFVLHILQLWAAMMDVADYETKERKKP